MSYSIGEVAKMLGLSTYAIRYYDQEGLLPFVKRDEHGVRVFEKSDLHFLYVIFCLKNTGHNVWPYWRELVSTTTQRLGLPHLTLPLQKPVKAKED